MILSNDIKYKGEKGKTLKLDEKSHVEDPFLDQLESQGWDVLRLQQVQKPKDSNRTGFNEVVILPKLEKSLKKINPFLTDNQVHEVSRKITGFTGSNLLENNKKVLDYLIDNTTVAINEETGEVSPTVRFIDFDELENNSFLAICQFKVKIPGTDHHIVPDIVLFINGLPLVVVECKSSKVKEPIPEAIDQLMRYSEQRGAAGEGNPELFYYNQFWITTCRTEAKFGTLSTHTEKLHYRWTDPYPKTLKDMEHSGTSPNDQQRLVAGMLSPQNLLDLIRAFTIYGEDDKGRMIKIVARYQQFRAVKESVRRLLEGKNPRERSGIIWHTQGSGKSLTMMFMVRWMRLKNELLPWKIVFITDRTQLEGQLHKTSRNIGFTVKVAKSIDKLKEYLSSDAPDLVMGMIHKFQERDLTDIFPILNTSHKVLTMTDEAHRSQYSLLGANLDRALPNASRIAYTGTPIDKTEKTFGDYIDKYTMKQAIDDGVTLEIVYEGRTHDAEVKDTKGMDKKFADVFSEYNLTEKLQILGYGTRDAYLESMDTISAKAEDMVHHYIEHIFSNGFKAQVVAVSREAAVRYKTALDGAMKKAIKKLKSDNPWNIDIAKLEKLETAVVISGSHNDKPHIKAYTNPDYHKKAIERFKLPFGKEQDGINGNVGIIIVNNMLLTGFDAPIEQVLYLDKVIIAHNLLQAIARVNRVGPHGKEKGYVIDYVGIGNHLKRALDTYKDKEQAEIIDSLKNDEEELNELITAHREIWDLLKKYNCTDLNDPDAFFDLFYDEDIRFEYILAFKKLTSVFNKVLPRKEALEFFHDYQALMEINVLAYKHFRDDQLSMRGIPEKLRNIADQYLKSKGIEQKVAPISILDDDFQSHVSKRKRTKTKAAEIEHAIRHFINMNIDEDPELFASFARELERILTEFKGNWQRIYEELEKLRKKIRQREKENTFGLDRKRQMPVFRMLKEDLFDNKKLSEDDISKCVDLTQHVTMLLAREMQTIGFWESIPAQNKLKAELNKLLVSEQFMNMPNVIQKRKELITRFMDWAKKNHAIITSS